MSGRDIEPEETIVSGFVTEFVYSRVGRGRDRLGNDSLRMRRRYGEIEYEQGLLRDVAIKLAINVKRFHKV